jgi:hypothetical protein
MSWVAAMNTESPPLRFGSENAATQEIELGAAVPLAFDQLESVDAAFDGTGRPRSRECCVDRGPATRDPVGRRTRRRDWRAGVGEPLV